MWTPRPRWNAAQSMQMKMPYGTLVHVAPRASQSKQTYPTTHTHIRTTANMDAKKYHNNNNRGRGGRGGGRTLFSGRASSVRKASADSTFGTAILEN